MSNCEKESDRPRISTTVLSADTTSRLNLLEIHGQKDINSPDQRPCDAAYKGCTETNGEMNTVDEIYKYSAMNTQVRIDGKNNVNGDFIEFHTAPNGQKWEEARLVTKGESNDYIKSEGGQWGEVISDKPPRDLGKDHW